MAPSPTAGTWRRRFSYEADALRFRQREEVRLLDARGQPLGTLAGLVAERDALAALGTLASFESGRREGS